MEKGNNRGKCIETEKKEILDNNATSIAIELQSIIHFFLNFQAIDFTEYFFFLYLRYTFLYYVMKTEYKTEI